uniref:phage tail protein n=1 Tax=uncultured Desulfovibrio sp. TaxID=167968 RepID=UPI0025E539E0
MRNTANKFILCAAAAATIVFPLTAAHAADATSFNPTTVKVTAKPISSIPVGTIISWPVAQNPADWQNPDGSYNWLECNGQTISQTAYPELFALLGGRVPDLRGLFLRGYGS